MGATAPMGKLCRFRCRAALILVATAIAVFVVSAIAYADGCPVPPAHGRQPYPDEISAKFLLAGLNRLGSSGPTYPAMWYGYPAVYGASPYAPCILLMAIGQTESGGWKQFRADYGSSGYTVISPDCGYGIMQITSWMGGGGGFDPNRVASEYAYNMGTGAKILIGKWNGYSYFVGDNDPAVVEDWYYAVWAYNGWGFDGWVNHPNRNCPVANPDCGYAFNPFRPPFDGSQPRRWYPYQELVWGYAAHPPDLGGHLFWEPVALTLPPRSSITIPPPTHLDRPLPAHRSCCAVFLPGLPVSPSEANPPFSRTGP